jgi:catechol 2,3-dioxygenase-like lactoylglutathione lyase family enzyme
VTRVLHVSINANGTALDPLVAFYRDVLGLGDQPRPEIPGVPGHWHRIGDVELHLVGAPGNGQAIDPTGPHFCVAVDDLDAAVRELDERGITHVRGVQGEGVVQIWFADPAGNTIELQQETSPP